MSQELEPTPPNTDVLLILLAGKVSSDRGPFQTNFCLLILFILSKSFEQSHEMDAKKQNRNKKIHIQSI